MSNVENSLESKFEEFLNLLSLLCKYFDKDDIEIFALPMSTAIRVLVHDTAQSTSLLKHLNKKNVKFISTNTENLNENVHLGLVRRINVGVSDGQGGEARYWPLCNEKYFPMPPTNRTLDFEEWWDSEKIFHTSEPLAKLFKPIDLSLA